MQLNETLREGEARGRVTGEAFTNLYEPLPPRSRLPVAQSQGGERVSNEDSFDGTFDHLDPGASMVCKEDSFEYRRAIFIALRDIGQAFIEFKRETRQAIKELREIVEALAANYAKHEENCGKDRQQLNARLAEGRKQMATNQREIAVLKMQMLLFNGLCYLMGVITAAAVGKLFGMY